MHFSQKRSGESTAAYNARVLHAFLTAGNAPRSLDEDTKAWNARKKAWVAQVPSRTTLPLPQLPPSLPYPLPLPLPPCLPLPLLPPSLTRALTPSPLLLLPLHCRLLLFLLLVLAVAAATAATVVCYCCYCCYCYCRCTAYCSS
jgi:hypothetical protein